MGLLPPLLARRAQAQARIMLSASLEFLTSAPRPVTPPRWRATGEKITRAPAASPPFDSPASPSGGSLVDAKLRAKGANAVQRRADPVRSDAVLDALRSGYDTRGDMTAGGVKQAACAGGQPRWPAVGLAPKENRTRFSLPDVASGRRREKKYAAPAEQEQAVTLPGQGALRWNPPEDASLPHREGGHGTARRSVVAAGRRRGMAAPWQAKAARLDLAIEDVYAHAQQNLAQQRATIMELAAASAPHEPHQNAPHGQQAATTASAAPVADRREGALRVDGDSSSSGNDGGASGFLSQVKRRYDADGSRAGQAPPLAAAAIASEEPSVAQQQHPFSLHNRERRGEARRASHQQQRQREQQKDSMAVGALASLRDSHVEKLGGSGGGGGSGAKKAKAGRRARGRARQQQREEEEEEEVQSEWGVIGWSTADGA